MTVFSENLNRLMNKYDKTRKEISQDLGIPYTTITEWCKGNRTPKMDKIEELARYFHCTKSELLEQYEDIPKTDMALIEAYNRADEQTQAMVRRLLAYSERLSK